MLAHSEPMPVPRSTPNATVLVAGSLRIFPPTKSWKHSFPLQDSVSPMGAPKRPFSAWRSFHFLEISPLLTILGPVAALQKISPFTNVCRHVDTWQASAD